MLPLGGYVRMAGWGEDSTDIKTGTPASLTLNEAGKVVRINLSGKKIDQTALPMNVTGFDLENKLEITGLVLDEQKTYAVDHDATIVEEDGTEVRIAPLDVQYQNASLGGRLITNFAGPMNNFILGIVAFLLLIFMQGGVANPNTNHIRVLQGGALAQAGVKNNDQILKVGQAEIKNWSDLTQAVQSETENSKGQSELNVTVKSGTKVQELTVKPKKEQGRYLLGVMPGLKSDFLSMIAGGFSMAWNASFRIFGALKNLIFHPDINKLGGPVAIYKASSDAAKGGIESVIALLAMLSLNIGIFNLIPIPALDGGKIVLNLLEAIRRKPLKQETETYVTLAGVAIMVVLLIAVTWNDIMRTFF